MNPRQSDCLLHHQQVKVSTITQRTAMKSGTHIHVSQWQSCYNFDGHFPSHQAQSLSSSSSWFIAVEVPAWWIHAGNLSIISEISNIYSFFLLTYGFVVLFWIIWSCSTFWFWIWFTFSFLQYCFYSTAFLICIF